MIPYLNSSLFNTTTWNRNLVIHFPISCFKLALLKPFQMEILELPCDNADAANNRASLSDKSTEATGRKPRPPHKPRSRSRSTGRKRKIAVKSSNTTTASKNTNSQVNNRKNVKVTTNKQIQISSSAL